MQTVVPFGDIRRGPYKENGRPLFPAVARLTMRFQIVDFRVQIGFGAPLSNL